MTSLLDPADQQYNGFETVGSGLGFTLRQATSRSARSFLHDFIQCQFSHHYQAEVPDDTNRLLGVFDEAGELVAAFGLRSAEEGLFSQCYLEDELSDILARELERPVPATEIVELNHLSVTGPRTFRALVPLIAEMLWQAGYRYLICTATGCLIRYFSRYQLAPKVLAQASRFRLPADSRDCWGSYYESEPAVVFGMLEQARDRLAGTMLEPAVVAA